MIIRSIFLTIPLLFILSSCWPTSVAFTDSGSLHTCLKNFQMDPLEVSAPNAPINYNINLTEAVKNGIQNNTKLMLATGSKVPQVTITGKITSYSVMPIAIQDGDNSAKNRLSISAQMTINFNCPAENYDLEMKVNSNRFADFDASKDLSSEESRLLDEINAQIVQDVINQLLSNW